MYLFDFVLVLSPGFPEFPAYSMKHRLLFIQMTAMISDLPAVISTNTRRGCQAVTPGCCNDLFLPRD